MSADWNRRKQKCGPDDLFHTPLDQTQIDFENEGGETYICGNPPYLGFTWQSAEQKAEIVTFWEDKHPPVDFSTTLLVGLSRRQGIRRVRMRLRHSWQRIRSAKASLVAILWLLLFSAGCDILFAYTSFKWSNLASNKAGVTVVVVGIGRSTTAPRRLFQHEDQDDLLVREGTSITPYLTLGLRVIVEKHASSISKLGRHGIRQQTQRRREPTLGTRDALLSLHLDAGQRDRFIRRIYGSDDFINGGGRLCIWIQDRDLEEARSIEERAPFEYVSTP